MTKEMRVVVQGTVKVVPFGAGVEVTWDEKVTWEEPGRNDPDGSPWEKFAPEEMSRVEHRLVDLCQLDDPRWESIPEDARTLGLDIRAEQEADYQRRLAEVRRGPVGAQTATCSKRGEEKFELPNGKSGSWFLSAEDQEVFDFYAIRARMARDDQFMVVLGKDFRGEEQWQLAPGEAARLSGRKN